MRKQNCKCYIQKKFNNNNDNNKKGLSSKRSPPFCLKKGIKPVIALTRHNKKKKEHIKSCSKTGHRVCKLCRLLATKKNGYTCSRNKLFNIQLLSNQAFLNCLSEKEKQKSIPSRM